MATPALLAAVAAVVVRRARGLCPLLELETLGVRFARAARSRPAGAARAQPRRRSTGRSSWRWWAPEPVRRLDAGAARRARGLGAAAVDALAPDSRARAALLAQLGARPGAATLVVAPLAGARPRAAVRARRAGGAGALDRRGLRRLSRRARATRGCGSGGTRSPRRSGGGVTVPAGYVELRRGRVRAVVRADLAGALAPWLLASPFALPAERGAVAAGRGGAWRLHAPGRTAGRAALLPPWRRPRARRPRDLPRRRRATVPRAGGDRRGAAPRRRRARGAGGARRGAPRLSRRHRDGRGAGRASTLLEALREAARRRAAPRARGRRGPRRRRHAPRRRLARRSEPDQPARAGGRAGERDDPRLRPRAPRARRRSRRARAGGNLARLARSLAQARSRRAARRRRRTSRRSTPPTPPRVEAPCAS